MINDPFRSSEAHVGSQVVALVPGGDTIEDFLDPLSLSFDDFRDEVTGGWLFGYVEALAHAGVRVVVVCVSRGTDVPVRAVHRPTGAPLWRIPAPRVHRTARAAAGWLTRRDAAGSRLAGPAAARASLAAYLATTPARALAGVLREEGCNAVVCQEYDHPRFDACVALSARLDARVFATFQGGAPQRGRIARVVRPMSIRRAAGLIIGPAAEAERVVNRYGIPTRKVARIFNPLDVSAWSHGDARDEARAMLGIPAQARVAAWHGRVEIDRKGLDVLVDAWDRIQQAPGAAQRRLLLVGTGHDAPELAAELERRRLPGVVWRNEYVGDKATLARLLAAADVYAFPSRLEGFPVAPLEAMACGLPVVAADASGVGEILADGEGSGGLIVSRGDAPGLASALADLLDDPRRAATVGANARVRVERGFSLEAVGAQLRDFLFAERHGARETARRASRAA